MGSPLGIWGCNDCLIGPCGIRRARFRTKVLHNARGVERTEPILQELRQHRWRMNAKHGCVDGELRSGVITRRTQPATHLRRTIQ